MFTGGGGGGRLGQVPSTSTTTEPRQLPSFGHGGWTGGGVDQCTSSYPYVKLVGEDQQYGHPGGCSQRGMPSGHDPTAMLSGKMTRSGGLVAVLCMVLDIVGVGWGGLGSAGVG